MRVLGYKKEKIRPLNDARAIDAGADFLGEAFIFSVAVSLIFAEQIRSRNQARRQRDALDDRLDEAESGISDAKDSMRQLVKERQLLRSEVDNLVEETAMLRTMLMQAMGKELEKHGISRGHPPTKVSQELVDKFGNGEDIDTPLRAAINGKK